METPNRPLRLLLVLPNWVGDVVMATPALRRVRRALPGSLIGALCRPGIDQLLSGTSFIDQFHPERASGVMGPKRSAAGVRHARYDTALLFTNSFSSALAVRMAGIPRRIGYDRDGRGLLLTQRLAPPKAGALALAPVPACTYYWRLAEALVGASAPIPDPLACPLPAGERMELGLSDADKAAGESLLARAGLARGEPYAVLNPGASKEWKRWPAERFAELGRHLASAHGMRVVVNGSPAEADIVAHVVAGCPDAVGLAAHGVTLGSLKAVIAGARLLVTNDTGPRHIAAAMNTPVVTLMGPTDWRWSVIPAPAGERVVLADPDLPPDRIANDNAERCAMTRIDVPRVVAATEGVLVAGRVPAAGGERKTPGSRPGL
ncbi:MAG TPA: glycosyltransferase family 9 protein [Phycisphaerales bacterium]|nr:glycosyltransferase family 9 protein [Phycisphaerales bacterium]